MLTATNQRLIVIGLYVNAVLLGAGVLVFLSRSSIPSFISTAHAQNQPSIGGGGGVFVMPGQFGPTSYGCYLLDIDAQTICAYQYVPNASELKLLAARHFRYDRQLKNYNSGGGQGQTGLSWVEVKEIVEREAQANRVQEQNIQRPPVEQPR